MVAKADIMKAEGQLRQAKGALQQAQDELETKRELQRRNAGIVPQRDIEKLEVAVDANEGGVAAAEAAEQAMEDPRRKRASVREGERRSRARAGASGSGQDLLFALVCNGRVEQFLLRVGDVVNPLMRPAGVLIPEGLRGSRALTAGFSQIEAQIMNPGMIAEVTCVSKPFTVIPMVVTDVQDFIAAGQFRGGEQLIDAQQVTRPGTLMVYLEPLYKGGLEGITPGSSCIANAYSNNHDAIHAPGTGAGRVLRCMRWTRSGWCMR